MSLTAQPPSFHGIHHLKLPVSSLRASREFYTTALPFVRVKEYDHYMPDGSLFAHMLRHEPTGLLLELRYHPAQAAAERGWDPITWGVRRRADLEQWGQWLDERHVPRSRVFRGVLGWVMACEDPDGRIVRLYVIEETHEWSNHPDTDERWLGFMQGDPDTAPAAAGISLRERTYAWDGAGKFRFT